MLLGAGAFPLADATVVYPEETAAMREAWAGREPAASQLSFAPPQARDAFFYRRIRGVAPC
jgi:hypothetical protein